MNERKMKKERKLERKKKRKKERKKKKTRKELTHIFFQAVVADSSSLTK